VTSAANAPAGEVFDLGYQGYDGERRGRWSARQAMWRDGVRVTLGLGRSMAKKVAPFAFIGLAWLPAVIVIVISGFVSTFGGDSAEEIEGPTFSEYYEFSFLFILLFAAVVGPELLCPDRSQGVITLYLVRPITTTDYVAARWLAFLTVATFALWTPQALIFVWSALSARDPWDWARDNWDAIPRFMAAGLIFGTFLTTLTMTVSSFTTRRPYAAIGTLAFVGIGGALGGIGEEAFSGAVGDWMSLLNFTRALMSVSNWIFDAPFNSALGASTYLAWLAALTVGMNAVLWWRYRGLG
jgi:ABC-2 type transport system permease protein